MILLLFSCKETQSDQHTNHQIIFQDLFSSEQQDDINCYRIPSILYTQSGKLIAAIDERKPSCGDLRSNNDINIVMKTSLDQGDTWSAVKTIIDLPFGKSVSDPSMIQDQITGEIFLFFNYMDLINAPNQYFLQYISSKDDGKTWSQVIDITNQITKKEWKNDFKFITSGRGTQTRHGKILHTLVNLEHGLHVFGSDDHGKSWFLIDTPIEVGDESKIIALNDGTWMINSRVAKAGYRYIHQSKDQGKSWVTHIDSTLIDPACNASLVRLSLKANGSNRNRLLFSNAYSQSKRENLTLHISYDEGKTWKFSKTIYKGPSAYSSICILRGGDIGIFFEKDDYKQNVFTKVTLDWLTNGEDKI